MPKNYAPMDTPNVVVSNPTVRKTMNWVLGIAMLLLPVLTIIDTSTPLDLSPWLAPVSQIVLFLGGVFGIAVINPNIPSGGGGSSAVG